MKVLVHYNEIGLKGRNRAYFENSLINNIRKKIKFNNLKKEEKRVIFDTNEDINILKDVFGISHFSIVEEVENKVDKILDKLSEYKDKELNTIEWKKILDEIQEEGCVYLTLSGGEPLIRDDFLELYTYAKRKGFIIGIFTNGQALRQEILDFFIKSPPFSIEITLNGITKATCEAITQAEGSWERFMGTIRQLKKRVY